MHGTSKRTDTVEPVGTHRQASKTTDTVEPVGTHGTARPAKRTETVNQVNLLEHNYGTRIEELTNQQNPLNYSRTHRTSRIYSCNFWSQYSWLHTYVSIRITQLNYEYLN